MKSRFVSSIKIEAYTNPTTVAYTNTVTWANFPAGEVRLSTPNLVSTLSNSITEYDCDMIKVTANIFDSDALMALLQVSDIVKRAVGDRRYINIVLEMPYVPYGRQDKQSSHVGNESLSLEHFANIINLMRFDQVRISDPHSYMSLKLINNCKVVHHMFSNSQFQHLKAAPIVFLSPDESSRERCLRVAHYLSSIDHYQYVVDFDPIVCTKTRDPSTGNIQSSEFATDVDEARKKMTGAHVLVFDDICDGGSTHIRAAHLARGYSNPLSVNLYVTHGFFSNGKDALLSVYDTINAIFEYEMV